MGEKIDTIGLIVDDLDDARCRLQHATKLAAEIDLHDLLADGGFTDLERTVRIAVLYGVPALVFTMSTWRATTVFDEVIELRWLRWRTEWEYTLTAFAAQPPPGPEASPVISGP